MDSPVIAYSKPLYLNSVRQGRDRPPSPSTPPDTSTSRRFMVPGGWRLSMPGGRRRRMTSSSPRPGSARWRSGKPSAGSVYQTAASHFASSLVTYTMLEGSAPQNKTPPPGSTNPQNQRTWTSFVGWLVESTGSRVKVLVGVWSNDGPIEIRLHTGCRPHRIKREQRATGRHQRRHVRAVNADAQLAPEAVDLTLSPLDVLFELGGLKTENGRKNVKSARYRPILSANGRRPRPAHAYACADPAQNGQNGGN